jgi:hypothetical protein
MSLRGGWDIVTFTLTLNRLHQIFENALLVLRRWYPQREIVAVADRAYASLKLLDQCRKLSNPITSIPRLRLDAALYEPAPPRRPVR